MWHGPTVVHAHSKEAATRADQSVIGAQREVLTRPVPEDTVMTHRAPCDPAGAGSTPVVQFAEEGVEELDLVTPCSDTVIPYAKGQELLASLEKWMTRNEDAISQLVSVQDRQMRTFGTVQQSVANLTNSIRV